MKMNISRRHFLYQIAATAVVARFALASDGTGYILAPCHNLQGITPLENILALYEVELRRL
jgi:uroporphyrinogen decarboxylase